jgi:hypothetical protein
MTDYLGPTLSEIILVVPSRVLLKPEPDKEVMLSPRKVADLSDWILYVATAVLVAEVIVLWSH